MVVDLSMAGEGQHFKEHHWMEMAEEMISAQKVMTLAVAWQKGAWSSPVYYLYRKQAFYFFSGPDSRHIRGSMQNGGRAGCSIFKDAFSFNEIRGVQMEGIIKKVPKNREGVAAAGAYLKRFAIPRHGNTDALAFIKQQYRASFYRFVPRGLVYMDNRVAMGFKKELEM